MKVMAVNMAIKRLEERWGKGIVSKGELGKRFKTVNSDPLFPR
jgi:hypothetical protein